MRGQDLVKLLENRKQLLQEELKAIYEFETVKKKLKKIQGKLYALDKALLNSDL